MMSKTNALRKIIQSKLSYILSSYYRFADENQAYPYLVYDFESIDLNDLNRDDLILIVDIWCKGSDTTAAEEYADCIEDMFNAANLPGDEVLPTFFKVSRKPIDDPDKSIIHRQLKFQVQNYYIGG